MAIVINGSGTVTGISVGGLPDGVVDAGTLADDAVVEAKIGANAVVTAAINDDAVTNAKVAANAIAEAQLAANAVVTGKIENGTIISGDMATAFYQTGSWTPVLSGSATATIAQNKYVRLGNVVHCWSQIQNIGNIPGSGAFYIDSGLPFAPALDASVCGSVMLNYVNINGGSTYTVVPLIDAAEDVYLYKLEDNDEWGSVQWSAFSTNDDVQIYLTYYTEA